MSPLAFISERIATMPAIACCSDEDFRSLDFLTGNHRRSLLRLFQRIGSTTAPMTDRFQRGSTTHASNACGVASLASRPPNRFGTGRAGRTAWDDDTGRERSRLPGSQDASR